MKLACTYGNEIVALISAVAEKKGEVKAYFLNNLQPISKRKNKIDSIFATIHLQENRLERETVEDILNFQAIAAPKHMILQVKRAMQVYDMLSSYNPFSQQSFRIASRDLHNDPQAKQGYRTENTHFFYHDGYLGLAAPVEEMKKGAKRLFHYLRHSRDPLLIKSCLCHYAIQFYQPFQENNEKMSRLWQTLLLMQEHPAFEFIPWEMQILNRKKEYLQLLGRKELQNDPSEFVLFMLEILDQALAKHLESCRRSIRPVDRIRYFYTLHHGRFTRKDYMLIHKNISMATASRDLNKGVEMGFFEKHGNVNQSFYICLPQFG